MNETQTEPLRAVRRVGPALADLYGGNADRLCVRVPGIVGLFLLVWRVIKDSNLGRHQSTDLQWTG
jgi:hypothetical protein